MNGITEFASVADAIRHGFEVYDFKLEYAIVRKRNRRGEWEMAHARTGNGVPKW